MSYVFYTQLPKKSSGYPSGWSTIHHLRSLQGFQAAKLGSLGLALTLGSAGRDPQGYPKILGKSIATPKKSMGESSFCQINWPWNGVSPVFRHTQTVEHGPIWRMVLATQCDTPVPTALDAFLSVYNPGFSTVGEILQLWGVGGTIPLGVWGVPVTRVYVCICMSIRWHTVFLDSKNRRGQSGHQGSTHGAKDGTVLFMRSSLLTENHKFYTETIALVMCHFRFLY